MNFFIFWILSILLSYGFGYNLALRMIKDFADEGYLLDTDKMKDLVNYNEPIQTKTRTIFLTPGINLLYIFYVGSKYNERKHNLFYGLKFSNSLIKMSDEELKAYEQDSSLKTILSFMFERNNMEQMKESIIEKLKEENILENEEETFEENKTLLYEQNSSLMEEKEEKPKVKTLKK